MRIASARGTSMTYLPPKRASASCWASVRRPPAREKERTRERMAWERGGCCCIVLLPASRLPDAGRHLSFPVGVSAPRAAINASWGTSTRPMAFMRFLPSFCFSSSLRLRVMSPP